MTVLTPQVYASLSPHDRRQVDLFQRFLAVSPPVGEMTREDVAWLERNVREFAFPDWTDFFAGEACWGMGV